MTTPREDPTRRGWKVKFADAFRGLKYGVEGQRSFDVHLVAAVVVILAAWFLQVSRPEWGLLLLCIALVLVAEMFNSALEWLAKAVDSERNPLVGRALDIASGAVLIAAIGAATVGLVVLAPHLVAMFEQRFG